MWVRLLLGVPNIMTTGTIYLQGKNLYFYNDIKIGEIFAKEDGLYDWWPDKHFSNRYIPSYLLRAIADLLDEMNKPMERQFNDYMSGYEAGCRDTEDEIILKGR